MPSQAMKKIALLLALLPLPANALDDDLFWRKGAGQGPTVRSFLWQGKLYQNIRIANYDGRNVELTTGKESFQVPESRIPPLWRNAVQRRNWPDMRRDPQPVAIHGQLPEQQPAKPEKVVEREPAPILEFTSYQQWGPARAAALAKARGRAAEKWPDDYVKQLEQVRVQMDAWDALYPRPGSSAVNGPLRPTPESSSSSYPKSEEPFRIRSVPLPSDTFTSDIIEIRTYNNRRVAARIEALAAAKQLARSKWPDPQNNPEREAETTRLMALWDEVNFEINPPE